MGWAELSYSRSDVDAAGRILVKEQFEEIDYDEVSWARTVINNWRSSHAFPLNTFQNNLRGKVRPFSKGGDLVAQRIKRLPAIQYKLENRPYLRLSEMQDIGGCRAVVRTVGNVRRLRKAFKDSDIKHDFVRETDYIVNPKDDGYRSIHLIYRYRGSKTKAWDGLKIEVQLRTQLQHAWATAVETVGQFRQEMLKSDQGHEDWLRFFALMGTAIAIRENCPIVPDTPSSRGELGGELRSYVESLDVVNELTNYQTALRITPILIGDPELRGAHYFLLRLDPVGMTVNVTGYRRSEVEEASRAYQDMERTSFAQPGPNVVLVSVDRITALKRAYPNFFLDTSKFLNEVRYAIDNY